MKWNLKLFNKCQIQHLDFINKEFKIYIYIYMIFCFYVILFQDMTKAKAKTKLFEIIDK